MTKTQKVIVVGVSIGVSIFIGALLFVYFKKRYIYSALKKGKEVDLYLKKPILKDHTSATYKMKVDKKDGDLIFKVKQNGDDVGYYKTVDGVPKFVSDAEDVMEIENKEEFEVINHLFKKIEK